jgi:hypothetical protein
VPIRSVELRFRIWTLLVPNLDCPQNKQRLVILRTSILLMGLEGRPNRGEYLTSSSVRRARESVSKLVKIERLAAGILRFYNSVGKQEHKIAWR